jgi:hypothetical protein
MAPNYISLTSTSSVKKSSLNISGIATLTPSLDRYVLHYVSSTFTALTKQRKLAGACLLKTKSLKKETKTTSS